MNGTYIWQGFIGNKITCVCNNVNIPINNPNRNNVPITVTVIQHNIGVPRVYKIEINGNNDRRRIVGNHDYTPWK